MLEHSFGVSGETPVGRMLEYGSILRDLLVHGQASLEDATTASTPRLARRPATRPDRRRRARRMYGAAGRFADAIGPGSHPPPTSPPSCCPPRAGRRAGRQAGPRIVAAVPAALTSDRRAALAGLNVAFGMMAGAPSYLAMLEACRALPTRRRRRLDGGDARDSRGVGRALDARVRQLADAGADEVVLWPFVAGGDPSASLAATLDTMQLAAQ